MSSFNSSCVRQIARVLINHRLNIEEFLKIFSPETNKPLLKKYMLNKVNEWLLKIDTFEELFHNHILMKHLVEQKEKLIQFKITMANKSDQSIQSESSDIKIILTEEPLDVYATVNQTATDSYQCFMNKSTQTETTQAAAAPAAVVNSAVDQNSYMSPVESVQKSTPETVNPGLSTTSSHVLIRNSDLAKVAGVAASTAIADIMKNLDLIPCTILYTPAPNSTAPTATATNVQRSAKLSKTTASIEAEKTIQYNKVTLTPTAEAATSTSTATVTMINSVVGQNSELPPTKSFQKSAPSETVNPVIDHSELYKVAADIASTAIANARKNLQKSSPTSTTQLSTVTTSTVQNELSKTTASTESEKMIKHNKDTLNGPHQTTNSFTNHWYCFKEETPLKKYFIQKIPMPQCFPVHIFCHKFLGYLYINDMYNPTTKMFILNDELRSILKVQSISAYYIRYTIAVNELVQVDPKNEQNGKAQLPPLVENVKEYRCSSCLSSISKNHLEAPPTSIQSSEPDHSVNLPSRNHQKDIYTLTPNTLFAVWVKNNIPALKRYFTYGEMIRTFLKVQHFDVEHGCYWTDGSLKNIVKQCWFYSYDIPTILNQFLSRTSPNIQHVVRLMNLTDQLSRQREREIKQNLEAKQARILNLTDHLARQKEQEIKQNLQTKQINHLANKQVDPTEQSIEKDEEETIEKIEAFLNSTQTTETKTIDKQTTTKNEKIISLLNPVETSKAPMLVQEDALDLTNKKEATSSPMPNPMLANCKPKESVHYQKKMFEKPLFQEDVLDLTNKKEVETFTSSGNIKYFLIIYKSLHKIFF